MEAKNTRQGHRQDFHGGVSEEGCAKRARKKFQATPIFTIPSSYTLLRTIATMYWQVFRENDRKIIEILQFYGS